MPEDDRVHEVGLPGAAQREHVPAVERRRVLVAREHVAHEHRLLRAHVVVDLAEGLVLGFVVGVPVRSCPHGSLGTGRYFRKATETGLNRDGSIVLLTNGAGRVIWRPRLHAGEAKAEKSPLRMACVGTKLSVSAGLVCSIFP